MLAIIVFRYASNRGYSFGPIGPPYHGRPTTGLRTDPSPPPSTVTQNEHTCHKIPSQSETIKTNCEHAAAQIHGSKIISIDAQLFIYIQPATCLAKAQAGITSEKCTQRTTKLCPLSHGDTGRITAKVLTAKSTSIEDPSALRTL